MNYVGGRLGPGYSSNLWSNESVNFVYGAARYTVDVPYAQSIQLPRLDTFVEHAGQEFEPIQKICPAYVLRCLQCEKLRSK